MPAEISCLETPYPQSTRNGTSLMRMSVDELVRPDLARGGPPLVPSRMIRELRPAATAPPAAWCLSSCFPFTFRSKVYGPTRLPRPARNSLRLGCIRRTSKALDNSFEGGFVETKQEDVQISAIVPP